MSYYMNRDKLDRYILTRPRNICPKTALNPSAITQFAKEKPANFMEAVLSLTTWFCSWRRSLNHRHEEYNEESKIESQTLHYMDVFAVEFVVQLFWERFRTKFFLAKSANSQKWRHTMTVSSLSLPKRKPFQTMQEWIKNPNKYPNYPKSQTLKSYR